MESKQAGIFRLLIIIVFFCMSMFFLNNNKKSFVTATHIDICNIKIDSVSSLYLDNVYQEMGYLFLTHDMDLIVKTMSQFKYVCAYELIEKMIQDETIVLSSEEKVNILYGIAFYAGPKKSIQYEWFDLLLQYPSLHTRTPVLLSLARSKYADLIAVFILWGKDRQKALGKMGLLAGYAQEAFKKAVEDNDYEAVEILFSKKVRIVPEKASQLLHYIVETGKDGKLISLFVDHAQADINYMNNGKSLLVVAVEKNNLEMVRVLLDKGAVVDRIIDEEKSTALTIAMKHKYRSVAQLLREYGA